MNLKTMPNNIKRRLIIIANTGGEKNYCPSVIEDRKNYLDFFKSPEGGNWFNSEIIAPDVNSWTKEKLAAVMDEQEEDGRVNYWLIVFAGHGWENSEGHPFLELYPNSPAKEDLPVDWLEDRVKHSSCLLIADCCRNIYPLTESIGDSRARVKIFAREGSLGYSTKCRLLYNQQLKHLYPGLFVVGAAASFKEGAKNMPSEEGGLYSYHLLDCAYKEIEKYQKLNEEDKTLAFSYIHSLAKPRVIRFSRDKQHPELWSERGAQPPFCVIPQWRI